MSTLQVTKNVERAELVISVDGDRDESDHFKLPVWLIALVVSRLATLTARNAAASPGEGAKLKASKEVRQALDRLNGLLRDGYNHIAGIGSYAISEADRLATFVAYGWEGGKIGDFTDPRIEDMARRAITTTPAIGNPAWRYPDALVTLIGEALDTVNAYQPAATGAMLLDLIQQRNLAADALQIALARVRFFYCCASDATDGTNELRKIAFQPRRGASTSVVIGGDTLPTFVFNWSASGELTVIVWFQMPEGLEGVTNVLLVEGENEFSTTVSLDPGQSQQVTWENVTIEGEIDEVVLRDADNEVLARGVRDETLADPGP